MYASHAYGSSTIGGVSGLSSSPFFFVIRKLRLYYKNILESAIVTVTSENPSYPKYRLYDRNIGLLFKSNSTPAQFDINIDLGELPSYPEVDTIILPGNHNFSGETMRLYYSDDGISYYQVLAWFAETSLILKSFASMAHRYWRFRIESPSSPPELSELFLTKKFEFERGPSYGYTYGNIENVNRLESKAGQVQKTIWGEQRQKRGYDLIKLSDQQRRDLELFRVAAYGKNFYLEDLEENVFFAELPSGLGDFKAEPIGRWGLTFMVQEILP